MNFDLLIRLGDLCAVLAVTAAIGTCIIARVPPWLERLRETPTATLSTYDKQLLLMCAALYVFFMVAMVDPISAAVDVNDALAGLLADGLAILGSVVLAGMARRVSGVERLIATQSDVASDVLISQFRDRLIAPEHQGAFDVWIARVRSDFDVVRLGHLYWIEQSIRGSVPESAAPPSMVPPPDSPYRIEADAGAEAFRSYAQGRMRGETTKEVEASLMEAARHGSSMAMTLLGTALVKGLLTHYPADAKAGLAWLERACALPWGSATAARTLASLLIDGEVVERDVRRALQLLEAAARKGDDLSRMELAAIYLEGRHGIEADWAKARSWALKAAPYTRQWLHRRGFPQDVWLRKRIASFVAAQRAAERASAEETR